MPRATNKYTIRKAIAVPMAKAVAAQMEMRQAAVVRSRLGIFQDISYTTYGVDQRLGCGVVYLAAQPVNMHINHVSRGVNPHPPYVVQNHGAGHYPACIAAEIF